ncbi:MAG: signal peptidase I [Planctomycetota bacterium]
MSESESSPTIRRNPYLAALLSTMGPTGQLYAGRGRRAIVLAVLSLAMAPAAGMIAVSLTGGQWMFNAFGVAVLCWPVFVVVDAIVCVLKPKQREFVWYQRWWMYLILMSVYLAMLTCVVKLTNDHIASLYVIPTNAMSPAVVAGDRILTTRQDLGIGDVVAFDSAGSSNIWTGIQAGPQTYLSRVIALEGDVVEIKGEVVYVNGNRIEEPYANFAGRLRPAPDLANMRPVTVPKSHFFVLGDQRRDCSDSRLLGTIACSEYVGTAVRIYWSRHRAASGRRNGDTDLGGAIVWERIGKRIR